MTKQTQLKPKAKTYPQTERAFTLQKISVERGKTDYPEFFYFKLAQAKECQEIAQRLAMGLSLVAELKAQGLELNAEQRKHYKAFRNGANFLIKKFNELAEHIAEVDSGDFEPTPYRPISKAKGIDDKVDTPTADPATSQTTNATSDTKGE